MNPSKNSELSLRIMSAAVLGILVLAITWFGGWPFRILAGIAAVLIFHEWKSIVASEDDNSTDMASLILVALIAGATVLVDISVLVQLTLVLVAGLLMWEWIANHRVWISTGVIYSLFPVFALVSIRETTNGLPLVLLLFVIVWATDIGAYFAGRSIGGPKLMPTVSPKKTWSGFFGGLIAAVTGCVILRQFFDIQSIPLIFALVLSVLSQGGDLFESWIKRRFGVKDSGNLIPGHGGIMDRVDGLVVAAVAFSGALVMNLV